MIPLAPVLPFVAVKAAVEQALGKHVPDTVTSFEELAGWIAGRANDLETALLGYACYPNVRGVIAEFVSEYCGKHDESEGLVKAADTVLDLIAFAEQFVALTGLDHIRAQMLLTTRPAVRLWIAHVVYRDHAQRLGDDHSLIRYCSEMMDHIYTCMTGKPVEA